MEEAPSTEPEGTNELSGAEEEEVTTEPQQEQEESLVDVSPGSAEEEDILHILTTAHLDQNFTSKWKPAKVQLITTKSHQTEFEEKKQDLILRARKPLDLDEIYGFVVENNIAGLDLVTTIGLQTKDSEYNALGYNRMGVYLCRHSDVCLQHALVKYSGTAVIRMVVCKFIIGRYTTAIPRVASAAEFIEPTQGFDCHTSVIPPSPKDSLQNQFDRSQVYLYEINKLLQPRSRPRQIIPYAVVHFTEDGAYTPLIDAEATSAEKLADNPRLQQIVNAINSKEEGSSTEATPGLAAGVTPANRTETPVAGSIPVITGGQINGGGSPNPVLPGPRPVPKLPMGMHRSPILMSPPSPAFLSGLESVMPASNHQLRRAITQLTAKLEAEERTKKAAGSDIIASQVKSPGLPLPQQIPHAAGLGVRMPGARPLPGGAPGVPGPMGGAAMPGAPMSQPPNGALHFNTPVGAYLGNMPNMSLHSPAVNNPHLGMLSPSLASVGTPGSAALLSGQNHHHHQPIAAHGTTLGHNGIMSASAALPPGFAFPAAPAVPKAAAASPAMPGAGILGSMPPADLARSTPMISMPTARTLTPDLQTAGFIPTSLSSLNPGVLGAGSSVMMSSAPLTYATLPHTQQLQPSYTLAGVYGSGLVPNYYGLDQQMALPKETRLDYAPGTAAILGAKDTKMPGVYYQAVQPAAAAYGQTVVLNQPLKRSLDVAHAIDKRIKYY